nr:MAG TPA: hypothetical protein [Caudoviricetes sp.]
MRLLGGGGVSSLVPLWRAADAVTRTCVGARPAVGGLRGSRWC